MNELVLTPTDSLASAKVTHVLTKKNRLEVTLHSH